MSDAPETPAEPEDFLALAAAALVRRAPPPVAGPEDIRIPHPVCGHPEYPDRIAPGGEPCAFCLREIDRQFAPLQPHPVCACPKPVWAHREDGPCGSCLRDIEREYVNPPQHELTWDDVRGARRVLLEATDWVETNPGRVARTDSEAVAAIVAYRVALLDIPQTFATPADVVWPQPPV